MNEDRRKLREMLTGHAQSGPKVCEHGSLDRSCPNCEVLRLEKDVEALLAVARAHDMLTKYLRNSESIKAQAGIASIHGFELPQAEKIILQTIWQASDEALAALPASIKAEIELK